LNKSRTAKLMAFGLIALFGAALALEAYARLFQSHRITVLVQEMDVARECSTGSLLIGKRRTRHRSSKPEGVGVGYCGAVVTDRGFYNLPDEKYYFRIGQSRREIYDALVPGCSYQVRIIGPGKVIQPGGRPRVPVVQMIDRVFEKIECDPE